LDTWKVNRLAVGDCAKLLRESLRQLGKKCSLRWIHYQCEPPRDVRRPDPYAIFWRWFQALWMANRTGAEFLLEDFLSRVNALRDLDSLQSEEERALLACADGEHGDIVKQAFLNPDVDLMMKEIAEDIAVKRRLLAFYAAQQMRARAA
jgi:hypothetical protein